MKVAIIGAGVSGILALKCCQDENLDAVCFEQRETYGGLWAHRPDPVADQTTVTQRVVCNTSKEMMAFSDFPPPQEFPLYMPQKKYKEYLELYVKNFNLEPNMKFNSKVKKCEYEGNKWRLEVEDGKTNVSREEHFDCVMLCQGVCQKPKWPTFEGMSQFSGQMIHAQQYRQPTEFSGKKVLVVGMGNTATETAVELTAHAEQVYISTINGKWIFKRLTSEGLPTDVYRFQRMSGMMVGLLPRYLQHILNKKFLGLNHEFFGLNQKSFLSLETVAVNDDMVDRFSCGKLILKPNVEKFTSNEVFFVDGTVLSDIDAVIFGTGYKQDYPFLEKSMLEIKDKKIFAYKHMFPPGLIDKNFAMIGCMNVYGPAAPLHETQCRLATRVFKGLVQLPTKEAIIEETKKDVASQNSVDPMTYQDELCEMIGCKPNIWQLLLSDLYLGLSILVGPFTPYQFRLTGPGKWSGAKSAIFDQWRRMYYPTNRHFQSKISPWMKEFLFQIILFVLFSQIFIFIFYMRN